MTRIGQNPAKFVDHVAQPHKVTVAIITYFPFLGGYYAEGLQILKLCQESLQASRQVPGAIPFDLMVFDNASCPEVRQYLIEQQEQGQIQFLVLSDRNIGKGGAWNFIFGAAPGDYIAYADSDVYFYPGWLEALLPLFDRFPRLGMVTGMPLRVPEEYSTSTLEWAQTQPEVQIERGQILPWEDFWRHVRSLGMESEAEARQRYQAREDICLLYQGERYHVGAGHFQFVAPKKVLQSLLPLPSDRPMGQMRQLDIAINQQGYLRLCTPRWWVQHLGNSLDESGMPAVSRPMPQEPAAQEPAADQRQLQQRKSRRSALYALPGVRKLLFWLHRKTFEMLYTTRDHRS